MRMTRALYSGVAAVALALALSGPPAQLQAQTSTPAVAIDNDDIGGVVTGPNGPEAGVWVIAETRDLPTRYAKMVVTDDQGRYVVPDLPKAKYKVWVRGYGLVDSEKVDAQPGQQLNLRAVAAPNDAEAAKYYPAIYWYSMLKIPPQSDFGGSSDIPAKVTLTDWMNTMKNNGCIGCHQLGQLSTRTIPEGIGQYSNSRRSLGAPRFVRTVRRADGQLCWPASSAACRSNTSRTGPTGSPRVSSRTPSRRVRRAQERNIVVTTWDWGTAEALSARPDRVRPALPDGQRLRAGCSARPNTRPTPGRSSTRRRTP